MGNKGVKERREDIRCKGDHRLQGHQSQKKRDLTEPKELKSYLGIDGNQLSFYLFWKKPPECISQLEKELESVFVD